ncbi:hypothetical protein PR048_017892 [Dryococelus australis]|uniref:Uncharacterized protein n=1 Tax=Dryococelus australis TaxID=614101 RepID=A0ABQ9HAX0_9NEOP|nr:hypothetical protein PR048_017892 [Dryococelus australis]
MAPAPSSLFSPTSTMVEDGGQLSSSSKTIPLVGLVSSGRSVSVRATDDLWTCALPVVQPITGLVRPYQRNCDVISFVCAILAVRCSLSAGFIGYLLLPPPQGWRKQETYSPRFALIDLGGRPLACTHSELQCPLLSAVNSSATLTGHLLGPNQAWAHASLQVVLQQNAKDAASHVIGNDARKWVGEEDERWYERSKDVQQGSPFTCTPITPNRQSGKLEQPLTIRLLFPRVNRGRLVIGCSSFPLCLLGVIGVHVNQAQRDCLVQDRPKPMLNRKTGQDVCSMRARQTMRLVCGWYPRVTTDEGSPRSPDNAQAPLLILRPFYTYFQPPACLLTPRMKKAMRLMAMTVLHKADEYTTEVRIELRRMAKAGETVDRRENPPTSGIVRHDSHMRKSRGDPPGIGDGSPWWEANSLNTTPPRLHMRSTGTQANGPARKDVALGGGGEAGEAGDEREAGTRSGHDPGARDRYLRETTSPPLRYSISSPRDLHCHKQTPALPQCHVAATRAFTPLCIPATPSSLPTPQPLNIRPSDVISTTPNMRNGRRLSGFICLPPTKANRVQSPAGSLWILASGNRAGRCRWLVGFLEELPFLPPLHSGAAPFSPHTLVGSQDLVKRHSNN